MSVVITAIVGYSDFVMVTVEGRVIALLLMVSGVGLFGKISGLVAAWFIRPGKKAQQNDILRLEKEVREMKRFLKTVQGKVNKLARRYSLKVKPPAGW